MYAALQKADVQAGDWVAILGAGGGLGHLAVQIASKGQLARLIAPSP